MMHIVLTLTFGAAATIFALVWMLGASLGRSIEKHHAEKTRLRAEAKRARAAARAEWRNQKKRAILNLLPWRRLGAATSGGTRQTRIAVVEGDGRCGMKVSGTSYHQSQLEALAGGRNSESAHHKCAALLLPEPDNAYDPNAVAVYIVANGAKTGVGYLQHDIAPLFNRCLLRDEFSAAACDALIIGGWHNNSGEDGNFGVRLDAFLPFRLRPLALPDASHTAPAASQPDRIGARPPPKAPNRRYRFAISTAALLAGGLFLGLYLSGRLGRTSAVMQTSTAPQTVRFECAAKTGVAHIVEVSDGKVRMWARFSPTLTNGPFGPFRAKVTPKVISWTDDKTIGNSSSITNYVIERQNYSLNIEIKNSWEPEVWRETSPCKGMAQ